MVITQLSQNGPMEDLKEIDADRGYFEIWLSRPVDSEDPKAWIVDRLSQEFQIVSNIIHFKEKQPLAGMLDYVLETKLLDVLWELRQTDIFRSPDFELVRHGCLIGDIYAYRSNVNKSMIKAVVKFRRVVGNAARLLNQKCLIDVDRGVKISPQQKSVTEIFMPLIDIIYSNELDEICTNPDRRSAIDELKRRVIYQYEIIKRAESLNQKKFFAKRSDSFGT